MQDIPSHYAAAYIQSPMATILSSIIKFPPENKPEAYKDLVCTESDQANIHEIITTMAENGKLSLLMKKGYLQNLGAQINHVHPLKFLSSIVMQPHLRSCLVGIFDDYFKRNGFMDGVGPSLSREAEKGKLSQYLNDFSEETGIPQDHLMKYFQSRDWEGLVRFFLISN